MLNLTTMYHELHRLSLDQYIDIIDTMRLNNQRVSDRKLNWYQLVKAGKLTCPVTKEVVSYVRYDERKNKRRSSYHLNFYSSTDKFMTIDHIIPKSKGGHHTRLDNIQPMEIEANMTKGDKITESATYLKG